MKYINIVMVWCVLALVSPLQLRAQNTLKIEINPVIKTSTGRPVQGAIVTSEEDDYSAVSDSLGVVNLVVTSNTYLSVAAPGYETLLIMSSPNLEDITLYTNLTGQNVKVAFQNKDKGDLMGGISYINMPEVLANNYITYPLDGLEGYVGGFNGNLWGNSRLLILVDGVPRDIGSVHPTEIAQVTFLKGVSAVALYGSKAAKGVIMVTTKRGVANTQNVILRTNVGVHTPRSYPEYLGSGEYMSLYNEARANDGLSPLYSENDIYNHSSGNNIYRYPNVDFYSPEYLQESYIRNDGNLEISGGNETARYYTNVGFMTEGTVLDFGQATENKNERFNVRGNIDLNLNDFITAKVDASAIFNNSNGVNANYSIGDDNIDFWEGSTILRPNRFTPLIPIDFIEQSDEASMGFVETSDHLIEGKYLLGGTQLDQTNPMADIYAGGSNKFTSRQFQFNAGVDANLRNVTEGLSFSSLFGLNYSTSYLLSFDNEYAVYQPSWTNYNGIDQIESMTKFGQDASSRTQNINDNNFVQTVSFSAQLNYKRLFQDKHQVSAMLIANGYQIAESSIYHKTSNANLGVYLGYNYLQKYYAEFSGALVHSAKLAEGMRRAFSPTMTLGWRIGEEDFLSSSSVVNDLRLSVSAGILNTDLDIDGFYLYEAIYTDEGSWYEWKDGLNNTGTDVRRGENLNLTFPKREEISLELDASLFNNSVTLNSSVFTSKMTGLFVQNSILYPSYFVTGWPISSWIPYVNYNNDKRSGVDFRLNLNKRVGEVNWTLGVSGLYYTTEASRRSENFENSYQNREGMPLDAMWGLENLGFFTGIDDIENSPTQAFGEVRPGDIKYKDQNNDGVVNAQDEVYLGRGGWSGAPLTMGFNLSASVNNFTLFALATLRTGAYAMRSNDYFWVNADDKYSAVVRDRWTEETQNTATFPRLTTLNGANNFRSSDFWLYSTNRLDLSKVQLSYSFPRTILGNGFIKELGTYISGSNLLTVGPNNDILQMNIGGAPQTRFYNFGIQAKF
ncbi:SusC/RagA family TonB-linked outer membrane protein [Algoriphagus sp. D3-2-R+10]|uniref:SusC/RagA family TonB-linked outer membrane protein n=1 Tax=Algoriphagus aurantiacus TaxID=3103948 RepID=UPI002B3B9D3B|nr:SusC/RagA family TonB-linked outer membrane protein [Algoriphagus sp. D3-2-R+10]MEB2775345.1 SusC/RagA family TonB-linked outer membrane protein [Algoriphagus sp. D3-2-R+10]